HHHEVHRRRRELDRAQGGPAVSPSRRVVAIVALVTAMMLPSIVHAADANQAGMAAYQRGDFEAAERSFQRAIAESPREPLFRYHRRAALTRLGRWGEAGQGYE